ncbi:sporulation protein YabP [Anoxybacter fermentans]|uniref:Sporulation protein YabP n=2 Tax=Anoxybacter fermentans TaxID=1323375 RepID=A0A3S9T342_9FIRM|nr:sporulation protein YabP [Anoxybacter fermentans]
MSSFEHKGENHEFTLTNRKYLSMSGVKEVISYNEHQIHLETVQGSCLVKGNGLNIQHLNLENGKLVVEGEISTIDYNVSGGRGFINRIFK